MANDTHMPFKLTDQSDSRITRVGKVLRATHLDELPQIWNICRGEMDLIGPRPVPLQLYTLYQEAIPDYDKRHIVRPGITGLAQIKLEYTTTLEGERKKWAVDVDYLTKTNITTDSYILMTTLCLLLTRSKASVPKATSQSADVRHNKRQLS
jgi:lipopolysaccharide/colanic/teichoic acid biosynthesis glycosyltransferase